MIALAGPALDPAEAARRAAAAPGAFWLTSPAADEVAIARDADAVGGRHRQPERSRQLGGTARRLLRGKRCRGDRDHAEARGCCSAAARKWRMYCTPENTDTAVDTYSTTLPARW